MSANTSITENLKATIEKVESYALIAASSAVVFVVLSFAKAKDGDVIRWELLGFPLDFSPPFALVVLFLLYFLSCVLVDNLVLHMHDLAEKLEQDQVKEILSYPSILTVSPITSLLITVTPAILITVGMASIRETFPMHWLLWSFAVGLGLAGLLVFVRFYRSIVVPYLPNWLQSSKENVQTAEKKTD